MTTPFQIFDALPGPVEDALRSSIERFGVLVPVVRDQHGSTLDGHHRARLADDLGVKYRVDVLRVADDDEARQIAVTLNTDRRQLDPEQRKAVVVALRELGHSTPAIGDALGVDDRTVRRDLAGSAHAEPERSTGKDGKSYPAKRPTVVPAATADVEVEDRPAVARAAVQAERRNLTSVKAPVAAPKKPRRGSLPDSARRAGWDFRKAAERLERIFDDDRFAANRERVDADNRGHLVYIAEAATAMLAALDEEVDR